MEPPPNIVPYIEVFDFDIEVMTSIYDVAKSVGLEPPPNIVPYIEVFYFDIEVMTSISKFLSTLYREIFEK